jgi:hypothetical protein
VRSGVIVASGGESIGSRASVQTKA